MSLYENYVKDFPSRVLELYANFLEQATLGHLEVTFLLSLTASGIAVPFDRLRFRKSKNSFPDPFDNRNIFKAAAKRFDESCEKHFKESELWDPSFKEWRYGILPSAQGDPNSWSEIKQPKKIGDSYTVEQVIEQIRDSLAHGILCTLGEKGIEKLLLLTGKAPKFEFLIVTPKSLGTFLRKWVDWLQTLDVSIWRKCFSPMESKQEVVDKPVGDKQKVT
jgi:hypothetical protein